MSATDPLEQVDINQVLRDCIIALGGVPVTLDLPAADAYNLLFRQAMGLLCAGGGGGSQEVLFGFSEPTPDTVDITVTSFNLVPRPNNYDDAGFVGTNYTATPIPPALAFASGTFLQELNGAAPVAADVFSVPASITNPAFIVGGVSGTNSFSIEYDLTGAGITLFTFT